MDIIRRFERRGLSSILGGGTKLAPSSEQSVDLLSNPSIVSLSKRCGEEVKLSLNSSHGEYRSGWANRQRKG